MNMNITGMDKVSKDSVNILASMLTQNFKRSVGKAIVSTESAKDMNIKSVCVLGIDAMGVQYKKGSKAVGHFDVCVKMPVDENGMNAARYQVHFSDKDDVAAYFNGYEYIK